MQDLDTQDLHCKISTQHCSRMLSSSTESNSSASGAVQLGQTVNANEHRLRDASSSLASEAEAPSGQPPRELRRHQGSEGGGGGGGGGGTGCPPPASSDSDSSSLDSELGGTAARCAASGAWMIADSGVAQIMEPVLRQLEAVSAEIGAPICRQLAANVELYVELKANSSHIEQLRQILSSRVDLFERLFLHCLAGLAGLLGLDAAQPDPDPALVDAFVAVRSSVESLAGRLRDDLGAAAILRLRSSGSCRDSAAADAAAGASASEASELDAEAAWSKAEAALDPAAMVEAFSLTADRAAWDRLRCRRLRGSADCAGEPLIFAELTRRKSAVMAAAGASPKFHHEEAVRYLLMSMANQLVSHGAG